MYYLHPGDGSNGLLLGFVVLALILWMLGRAFQLPCFSNACCIGARLAGRRCCASGVELRSRM